MDFQYEFGEGVYKTKHKTLEVEEKLLAEQLWTRVKTERAGVGRVVSHCFRHRLKLFTWMRVK